MTASILERTGTRLVHNRAGANMASGVASTLPAAAGRGGRIDGELGLFEVDEFWLDRVVPALAPRSLLLSNLFRDQLDRYGEPETIADRWAAMVGRARPHGAARAQRRRPSHRRSRARSERSPVLRGRGTARSRSTEMQHAADSKHCRRCGTGYAYEAVYLGHLGVYRCPGCGAERPGARRERGARLPLFRTDAARVRAAHPRRRASTSRCRCPGSTTSTTRSPPPRCAPTLGVSPAGDRRRPGRGAAPRSAAPSGSSSASADTVRCC